MAKDLKALIRLQKWHVDERRKILGQLLKNEAEAMQAIKMMERQHEKEKEIASSDPMLARGFDAYLSYYMKKLKQYNLALANIRRDIEIARDAVADEFKRLKTYEISQKNREIKEQYELDQKEQKALDEIGMNLHRQRQALEEDD